MRSRNKKHKAAYRRGERLLIFLKRGTILLLAVVLVTGAALGARLLGRQFVVKNVIVSGNYHLDTDEIVNSIKIKKGVPLLDVHFDNIEGKLNNNAWIKKVSLKKQLPDTVLINVEEATPKALLKIKKKLYLLDGEGEILESIKEDSTHFLPVIRDVNPKNRKDLSEALKLVDALSRKNIISGKESVEISLESYGLAMDIDGELIKVGYGNYTEKFEKWMELEPEIRRRGIPIKYVDLRFSDSIVVKPLKTEGKKTSS